MLWSFLFCSMSSSLTSMSSPLSPSGIENTSVVVFETNFQKEHCLRTPGGMIRLTNPNLHPNCFCCWQRPQLLWLLGSCWAWLIYPERHHLAHLEYARRHRGRREHPVHHIPQSWACPQTTWSCVSKMFYCFSWVERDEIWKTNENPLLTDQKKIYIYKDSSVSLKHVGWSVAQNTLALGSYKLSLGTVAWPSLKSPPSKEAHPCHSGLSCWGNPCFCGPKTVDMKGPQKRHNKPHELGWVLLRCLLDGLHPGPK